jgi:hypothetical protein
MTVEAWLLTATSVIAVVAVFVAAVAMRAVQKLKRTLDPVPVQRTSLHLSDPSGLDVETCVNAEIFVPAERPIELAPRVVEGRVIVPPTQAQVVRTALGRPGVRLSVLIHGLAHALRPENRDRIVALMRREYRHRRTERLRAGREAVRAAKPTHAPTTERLHADLLQPAAPGLAEQMLNP